MQEPQNERFASPEQKKTTIQELNSRIQRKENDLSLLAYHYDELLNRYNIAIKQWAKVKVHPFKNLFTFFKRKFTK